MHRTVYTAQKATFYTEVYGLSVTGCIPDAVHTAIKIQSTFQHLRESCLLWPKADDFFRPLFGQ